MNQTKVETFTLSSNPASLFALMNLSIGFLALCSCLAFPGDLKEEKSNEFLDFFSVQQK